MSVSDSIDSKLAQALLECERLQVENRQLRERLGIPPVDTAVQIVSESSTQVTVTAKSSPDEKVRLFRSLFRGREDVYAVRWEGRNGKTGCRHGGGGPVKFFFVAVKIDDIPERRASFSI